jgi:hypothetical protein
VWTAAPDHVSGQGRTRLIFQPVPFRRGVPLLREMTSPAERETVANGLTAFPSAHREHFVETELWFDISMKKAVVLLGLKHGVIDQDMATTLRAEIEAEEIETLMLFSCASSVCPLCVVAYLERQEQWARTRRPGGDNQAPRRHRRAPQGKTGPRRPMT